MTVTPPEPGLSYPLAARQPLVDELHGRSVPDPYRWLEDIDSPETRRWVESQAALAESYLVGLPGRKAIAGRLTELWNFEKFTPPIKRGGRYFFTRNDGLQNQPSLYWMEDISETPRLLLDPNTLSSDGTIALTSFSPSPDGRLLAYGLSAAGSDWQEWRLRRVDDVQDLEDCLEWLKFTEAAWTAGSQGFFYSRYDAPTQGAQYKGPNYNQKLYYHTLGQPQSQDRLVYQRPDHKEWGFSPKLTEDGRYLVLSIWQGTHRENGVFYQDLHGQGEVIELLKDFDASYQFVGSAGQHFYFFTDHTAPLGRVIAIDVDHPDPSAWETIVPQAEDAIQSVQRVGGRFVVSYLHDACALVRVFSSGGQLLHQLDLPGLGSVLGFEGQDTDPETFFLYTSFTTPGEIYRCDTASGQIQLFLRPQLHFEPQAYETRQVFYTSRDGTRVPMFLVSKKGLPLKDVPTYLYGYGGFNISLVPAFSAANVVWMEMGGLLALPNLRGGGEYGKAWHQAGKGSQKQNVFDDFIAAAEWLIQTGCTTSQRLGIGGRSNGGLLTGACLTQRPDLFGAVLVIVGVLDMLRFHQFTIGWAWVSDYSSPDDPDDFNALLAYSPYHNLKPGTHYPPTLVATGDHDDRVYPAHSFKFAAALQHAQAGPAPAVLRVDLRTGHGLGKPTTKLIAEFADMWAFMAHHLGLG